MYKQNSDYIFIFDFIFILKMSGLDLKMNVTNADKRYGFKFKTNIKQIEIQLEELLLGYGTNVKKKEMTQILFT